ncbi:MAG TPA: hypothetical protein VFK14_00245 [Solirubrobacterales bacterium]|nr:hypothetical protein [Solirubrobacterales bacterium]
MATESAATATETETTENNESTATETGEGTGSSAATGTEVADKPLGPEGEKALEAFKDRARAAERANKTLQAQLDKLKEASKTDSEKALDEARKQGRSEAEEELAKERRDDRLQVAVAGHARELADVDDVILNLKSGDTEELFDEDGKIISSVLDTKLEDLLKKKPHLKAGGTGKPRGNGNGGEGAGGEGTTFNDLLRGNAP